MGRKGSVIGTRQFHKITRKKIVENPRFKTQVKRAFKLALKHELFAQIGLFEIITPHDEFKNEKVEEEQEDRKREGLAQSKKKKKYKDKQKQFGSGIFNDPEAGIYLDAVLVDVIKENNAKLISIALKLIKRNRRYTFIKSYRGVHMLTLPFSQLS